MDDGRRTAIQSVLLMVLIGLLALNAWLVHTQTQITSKATIDTGRFVIQELHAYLDREFGYAHRLHSDRAYEHHEMQKLIRDTASFQNTFFTQLVNKKTEQDTKQHAELERACRR